jgi:hypothetical protein
LEGKRVRVEALELLRTREQILSFAIAEQAKEEGKEEEEEGEKEEEEVKRSSRSRRETYQSDKVALKFWKLQS